MLKKTVLSLIFCSSFLISCQSEMKKDTSTPSASASASPSAPAQKTLFERLGGKDALVAVVDDFVGNVAGDARINKFFADTAKDPERLKKFKALLVDQVCEATGGPCKYTGKNMMEAHKGMKLTEADFTALVEDLY
ncbi:MAG: group 1 truncated hemoglobin [Candidatus Sericytochromatia bacterium]